ncbi:MAG: hypothetical protein WBA12_13920, partial [Catalinimonas sp.]
MFFFLGVWGMGTPAFGQTDEVQNVGMIYGTAAINTPSGDLADRFGTMQHAGAGFLYQSRTHWLLGIELNYLFGEQVNEFPPSNLVNADGSIVGNDGQYVPINVGVRGLRLPTLHAGRLWPVKFGRANAGSGVFATVGVGYLRHRINYRVPGGGVPQLLGEYRKGYDRLTAG